MPILRQILTALLMFVTCTILCGLIYPAIVTLLAQILFPHQANGSIIQYQENPIGSALIGQNFSANKYFWGRPSATPKFPYNAQSSAGSNLGPSNPILLQNVQDRIATLQRSNPDNNDKIPIDLVTSSASGLDPHISIQAALWQASRIAKARNLAVEVVNDLIRRHAEFKALGIFGSDRVNVLQLNLALDQIAVIPAESA